MWFLNFLVRVVVCFDKNKIEQLEQKTDMFENTSLKKLCAKNTEI